MNHRPFDNRRSLGLGKLHLALPIGDKLIRYAYIRKNGCSAFKTAIGYSHAFKISEIKSSFRCKMFDRYDATIFVWRDPEDRAVSLFKNKILDKNDNEVFEKFTRFCNHDDMSFERFVEFCGKNPDPHCWPQSKHLKPIRYTHAIPLSRLHETMEELVGKEAAQPFTTPVNPSNRKPVHVTDRARLLIRKYYDEDFKLIEKLENR